MGIHAAFMRPCKYQMGLLVFQNVSVVLAWHENLLLTYMRTVILIKQRIPIACHSAKRSQSESQANVKRCSLIQNSLFLTVALLSNAVSDELSNLFTRWETISLSAPDCTPKSGDSQGWVGKPSQWIARCLEWARGKHWTSARMCLKS